MKIAVIMVVKLTSIILADLITVQALHSSYKSVCVCVYIYRAFLDLWTLLQIADFLGVCDQKSSYKYLSDFGRLRSYDRLKLRIEGDDYWQ